MKTDYSINYFYKKYKKEVKDKEDTTAIQTAMQALSDAIQKVGAAMYAQEQPAAGEQPTGGSDAAGADAGASSAGPEANPTVDAEFKEKE